MIDNCSNEGANMSGLFFAQCCIPVGYNTADQREPGHLGCETILAKVVENPHADRPAKKGEHQ